jgi:hypothetical protein
MVEFEVLGVVAIRVQVLPPFSVSKIEAIDPSIDFYSTTLLHIPENKSSTLHSF